MRCGKARRLMLLYREGELSRRQRVALTRHYASCVACAQAAEHIAVEFAPLQDLRRIPPLLEDPHGLTLRIMREVEAIREPAPPVLAPLRSLKRFLPALRVAAAVAASILVLVYVGLSYRDARMVALLEERFRNSGGEERSTAEFLAQEAASQLERQNPNAYAEAGLQPGDMGQALAFLISARREPAQVTIEDLLRRKYPALASVTLQDGLDDRERTILANEGGRFLKDLESLIGKEKPTHER